MGIHTQVKGAGPYAAHLSLDEDAIRFHRTVTLTSAGAATAESVLADSEVPPGKRAYVEGFLARVNGTTEWATVTSVAVQDTAGNDLVTVPVSALTSQARVGPWSADVVLEDALSLGSGGADGKGVQLVADADGTGSDLVVTVFGVIL